MIYDTMTNDTRNNDKRVNSIHDSCSVRGPGEDLHDLLACFAKEQ